MRKAAIVAIVAVGTSLAIYAGAGKSTANAQSTQTECCDKSDCCPAGGTDDCCEYGCE